MKLHWHKFFSEAPNCFNQKNHWHLSMWCDIHAVHSRFYTKGIKIYVFLFVFQKKNLCNCFAQILVKYFFFTLQKPDRLSLSLSLSPPIFNNFIVTIFFSPSIFSNFIATNYYFFFLFFSPISATQLPPFFFLYSNFDNLVPQLPLNFLPPPHQFSQLDYHNYFFTLVHSLGHSFNHLGMGNFRFWIEISMM